MKSELYEQMNANAAKYSVDLKNDGEQFDYVDYVLADTIDKSLENAIMLNNKIQRNNTAKLLIHIPLGKE